VSCYGACVAPKRRSAKTPRLLGARNGVSLLRRGLFGEGRWRVHVGLAIIGISALRRAMGRPERVVYTTELEPGQKLVIEHFPEHLSDSRR
jgi:hypothetical protein